MSTRRLRAVPAWCAALLGSCAAVVAAPAHGVTAIYEMADFQLLRLPPAGRQTTVDLFLSDALVRTPRNYTRVTATVWAEGDGAAALVLVDMLGRPHAGSDAKLIRGGAVEVRFDVASDLGRPLSMLRGLRLRYQGGGITVERLRVACEEELVPKPTVTVQGPRNAASIQQALDSLVPDGGVVYIPAGTHLLNTTINIPCDNITIYGDGRETVIEWTVWPSPSVLFRANGRQNLRFSRLLLRGVPMTAYRGYGKQGRPAVNTTGIKIDSCQNVRVDHCEIARFGAGGVAIGGGADALVDHCFLHDNFAFGLGYGVSTGSDSQRVFIEDNNFENHRHALCAGWTSSYIARYNRMVKDLSVLPDWQQEDAAAYQLQMHEIDAHESSGWVYAHDNYVSMRNGRMADGARMRGNPGWLYRNVFEHCDAGIGCWFYADDVWTWNNEFLDFSPPEASHAVGTVHFGRVPPDFREFPYPQRFAVTRGWPGARGDAMREGVPGSAWAGPEQQALRRCDDAPQ